MTVTTTAAPAVVIPKKTVFLNSARQAEAIAFWKSGTATLEELSVKFKVNKSTLSRLFKKNGAEKNETKDATTKIAESAVTAAIINDSIIFAQRVKETKEEHYKIATMITRIISSKVANTQKEGKSHTSIAGDVKTLQQAAMALKILREERYATLGISTDDVSDDRPMPDLIVQELTVEDIQQMSRENMVQDDDFDFDSLGDEELIGRDEQEDRVETN